MLDGRLEGTSFVGVEEGVGQVGERTVHVYSKNLDRYGTRLRMLEGVVREQYI